MDFHEARLKSNPPQIDLTFACRMSGGFITQIPDVSGCNHREFSCSQISRRLLASQYPCVAGTARVNTMGELN